VIAWRYDLSCLPPRLSVQEAISGLWCRVQDGDEVASDRFRIWDEDGRDPWSLPQPVGPIIDRAGSAVRVAVPVQLEDERRQIGTCECCDPPRPIYAYGEVGFVREGMGGR
jgi:hypothetical protein